jgi:hypothetical protein
MSLSGSLGSVNTGVPDGAGSDSCGHNSVGGGGVGGVGIGDRGGGESDDQSGNGRSGGRDRIGTAGLPSKNKRVLSELLGYIGRLTDLLLGKLLRGRITRCYAPEAQDAGGGTGAALGLESLLRLGAACWCPSAEKIPEGTTPDPDGTGPVTRLPITTEPVSAEAKPENGLWSPGWSDERSRTYDQGTKKRCREERRPRRKNRTGQRKIERGPELRSGAKPWAFWLTLGTTCSGGSNNALRRSCGRLSTVRYGEKTKGDRGSGRSRYLLGSSRSNRISDKRSNDPRTIGGGSQTTETSKLWIVEPGWSDEEPRIHTVKEQRRGAERKGGRGGAKVSLKSGNPSQTKNSKKQVNRRSSG